MRVIAGMSGGVDSAVAAWMLREQGHDVHGASLLLFESRGPADPRSCCSIASVNDAARTAQMLGIPHRVIDMRDEFMDRVIMPFAEGYAKGMTPNPCILCNRHVKFPALFREAGTDGMAATGHYAAVENINGLPALMRGVDRAKDQSYVLYVAGREGLPRLALPLGGMRKSWTRSKAAELGLPVFDRPESQEICFVERGKHAALVEALQTDMAMPGLPGAPGMIVDPEGRQVGTHQGIWNFTPGQRKGLGLASLVPLYVISLDASTNTVTVGPKALAFRSTFHAGDAIWLMPRELPFACQVQIRSTGSAVDAEVRSAGAGRLLVTCREPVFAPAPGQAAVFYDGDTVMGGSTILQEMQ